MGMRVLTEGVTEFFRFSFRPRSLVVTAVVTIAACSGIERQAEPADVSENRTETRRGFLSEEAYPDSLALLPPPPAEGSAALALDQALNAQLLQLRGTPRWSLATEDADMKFPRLSQTFSCALGLPITAQETPALYALLRRTLSDAGLSVYAAKNHYERRRPFLENNEPTCTPGGERFMRKDGSYPSGHTAFGWAWALILTEIAPERADALLARGRAFGESRMVCNVHWYSDIVAGRVIGAAAVARLHAEPEFRAAVESAKEEVATARARNPEPTRDCVAEAEALSVEILGQDNLTPN
jgi:acid phosphatase (class A)